MTMTKEPAIWALSIPRIFQAFSLSHGMLHDYLMVGLMMHFLAFARVVLSDLWFSHLILIRPSLLLLSPLCFSATATTTGITKISSAKLAKNASSKKRKHGICSFSRHTRKAAILVPLLSESR